MFNIDFTVESKALFEQNVPEEVMPIDRNYPLYLIDNYMKNEGLQFYKIMTSRSGILS
jgi:hypothetical protein